MKLAPQRPVICHVVADILEEPLFLGFVILIPQFFKQHLVKVEHANLVGEIGSGAGREKSHLVVMGIAGKVAADQLVKDHEKLSRRMREIAKQADEAGDLVTADMLTQRLTFHEKAIWMLRATVSS